MCWTATTALAQATQGAAGCAASLPQSGGCFTLTSQPWSAGLCRFVHDLRTLLRLLHKQCLGMLASLHLFDCAPLFGFLCHPLQCPYLRLSYARCVDCWLTVVC
jgi:hypothetical protein